MSREDVTHLCALLNDDSQPMRFGGHPMLVVLKITVALNFYASELFWGSTGNMCGVSQSSVHHCIKEVTNALFKRASDHIRYRTDPERQAEGAIGRGAIAGFSQVQSAIDCTHVAIKAPADQPVTFINRKGFHSLNVQLVCNHRKHFLQVCACFLGSCHDAYIPRQSQVPLLFTPPAHLQEWILGDKAYPLMSWLLTPGRNATNNAEECNTICHDFTQATIKQAIGMLKMRFCGLDRSGGALQYAPDRVGCIVVVCCILLYIAVQKGEGLQDEEFRKHETSSNDEDTEDTQRQEHMGNQRTVMETRQGE
ncbi:putative nuclease HARBI1 [Heterodontus francisci]|uniref:putative nuclease HARBI1 n=1 Tax=Heterodontus francisci TaxID=7792 RepID=UPI00355AE8D9